MKYRSTHSLLIVVGALALYLSQPQVAKATLKWYYDPFTGNVSFDSTQTRSGGIYNYYFSLHGSPPFDFDTASHYRLPGLTFGNDPLGIGQTTLSAPWEGLYTIGNVLPTGLSEQSWKTTFVHTADPTYPAIYGYVDVIGGGNAPDADFIYGLPTGEFKNPWGLVDPNTLAWATTAKLIYNSLSGEVLLDTTSPTSGYISSLQLLSNGAFLPGGFTPFQDVPIVGASPNNVHLYADAIEPGVYSLGNILPSGLTSAAFQGAFTSARFLGLPGFNGRSFDFQTSGQSLQLQFAAVPEPTTLALGGLMLGIACICGRRRFR